jgi:gluconate 5-dehydrogenase
MLGRRADVLQEAVRALVPLGPVGDVPDPAAVVADVADLASLPAVVEALEAVAPIDVLVNNAGRHHRHPTLDTTDEDFAAVLDVNVRGTFALTRAVARGMCDRGRGSIVVITSMAARYGIPGVAAYTASKSALDGLVRHLAVEFAPFGVRVNAIAPGFIETDMNRPIFQKDPARLQRILDRTPLRRLGDPSDVAEAALFLASDAAKFVTGVSLPVDGGNSIGF